MIPYLSWTHIDIGFVTIYVWGIFVACGFLFGSYVASRFAERLGLEKKKMFDFAFWMMAMGLLGGRIGHIVLYDPVYYVQNPLESLAIWHGGLSLFGGLIACGIFAFFYLRKEKNTAWHYAEAAVFGLPFGLAVGRIGCFLIHDHPGTVTHFFLGVQYPDGLIHHDHGLYLSINGFVMSILFLLLAQKQRSEGFYVAFFAIWYGVVRFFLDFYRLIDIRYYGLTPGQYLSIILVLIGVWLLYSKNLIFYGRTKT